MNVNCVGIDVSKGKSMIAVMRPLGEVVIPPFDVGHTKLYKGRKQTTKRGLLTTNKG